jgi:hypothetical protein
MSVLNVSVSGNCILKRLALHESSALQETSALHDNCINLPVVYMGQEEMILMWATSISRGIGRGGP